MSKKLLIVSCSKTKQESAEALPALELYTGKNYQVIKKLIRQGLFPNNVDIWIISTKYGLIPAEEVIRPYDVVMDEQRAKELKSSVERTLNSVLARNAYGEIFVNAGKNYLFTMQDMLGFSNARVIKATGPIGTRLSQMKAWLLDKREQLGETRGQKHGEPIPTKKNTTMVSRAAKERSKLTKKEWREYTKSVWSITDVRSKDHPAVFPEEIPHRLIKMFTFVGDVVLDPFAGTGTVMRVARRLGRNSISVDVNPKYVAVIQRTFRQNLLSDKKTAHKVYCHDSTTLPFIEDDSIGLVITSPPYWNKVKYDDNERNFANIKDYFKFVNAVEKVFTECFRVLMPGRKLCIVTGNVHEKTRYGLERFPLATDYIVKCRHIGYQLVGEIIWNKADTGSPWGATGSKRPIFGSYPYPPNFLFFNLHEYIIVLRKPDRSIDQGRN